MPNSSPDASLEKIPRRCPHYGWQRALGAFALYCRVAGHKAGTENLRRIIRASVEFGVKI